MRRQRGFNLIEMLIGLVISMMGLAAVSAVMMTFSKHRTAITQTLATQDNGVMALYRLERDISQAGYGLRPAGCTTVVDGANSFVPYPVVIGDGGAGSSDTLTIQGTNPASGIPGTELSVSGGNTMTSNQYNVRSSVGFSVNDRVVATTFMPTCTMTTVTSVTATAIGFTPALSATPAPGYLAYFGAAGEYFNRRYAVGATALTVADYPAYAANNLVDDIVFLKAQYGMADTATTTVVTSWVSGATALTASNVGRVIAIRVGVVARSAEREKEVIDQPNPLPVFPESARYRNRCGDLHDSRYTFALSGLLHHHSAEKRHMDTLNTCRRPSRQQGFVIILTLVILVIITLSAVAMISSLRGGISASGNIAFRQAATRAADVAVDGAFQWVQTQNGGRDGAEQRHRPADAAAAAATPRYYATMAAADSGCKKTEPPETSRPSSIASAIPSMVATASPVPPSWRPGRRVRPVYVVHPSHGEYRRCRLSDRRLPGAVDHRRRGQ